jgi:hypothetical protein
MYIHTNAGEPPPEWLDLQLCELYHCTPSELAEQDWETVMLHLELKAIEAKHLRVKGGR